MNRRRLLGATAVVVAILIVATAAVITLTGETTTQNAETISELAAEADQQRQSAATATDVAGNLVTTLGFGAAFGLGLGLLGGTTYAYRNRGMK